MSPHGGGGEKEQEAGDGGRVATRRAGDGEGGKEVGGSELARPTRAGSRKRRKEQGEGEPKKLNQVQQRLEDWRVRLARYLGTMQMQRDKGIVHKKTIHPTKRKDIREIMVSAVAA